jgi:hypothetical protein
MTLSEPLGVTGTRAVTVAAAPPAIAGFDPPCPPSAVIVTKQISAGTVAAPACNPGVVDANNEIGAALAEQLRDQIVSPAAKTATPETRQTRLMLVFTCPPHRRKTPKRYSARTPPGAIPIAGSGAYAPRFRPG